MEESKISTAEIKNLRALAEKEKQTRRRMQEYITSVRRDGLSAEQQMELVKRGKKDEILALLKTYSDCVTIWANRKMSAEAQLYLYEKGNIGDNVEIYQLLLNKVPFTDELAKRLIDDKKFGSSIGDFCVLQELSPAMQCYFLEYKLTYEACQQPACCSIQGIPVDFRQIVQYFNEYDFCEKAEVYLLEKCLNPMPFSEMYIEGCYNLVKKYITFKEKLSLAGEKALIASGKHKLILKYIKIAKNGLKAEDELLARGNREEVTAYFERYATL